MIKSLPRFAISPLARFAIRLGNPSESNGDLILGIRFKSVDSDLLRPGIVYETVEFEGELLIRPLGKSLYDIGFAGEDANSVIELGSPQLFTTDESEKYNQLCVGGIIQVTKSPKHTLGNNHQQKNEPMKGTITLIKNGQSIRFPSWRADRYDVVKVDTVTDSDTGETSIEAYTVSSANLGYFPPANTMTLPAGSIVSLHGELFKLSPNNMSESFFNPSQPGDMNYWREYAELVPVTI